MQVNTKFDDSINRLSKKILIIDDDVQIRNILEKLLSIIGFEIFTACDGYHAIEKLNKINVDLIITDYNMPGITGIDTIKSIKQINPDIPIIMISGHTFDNPNKLNDYVDVFFNKPVNFEKLKGCIEKLLNNNTPQINAKK